MENTNSTKLKKVLIKLLDPSFKINDAYLNLLLDNLKQTLDDDGLKKTERLCQEFFKLWLNQAVSKWETTKNQPSANILSFTLNLTAYECENEDLFVKLNGKNLFERLINVTKTMSDGVTSPSVKLGYIRLIASFLNHKSGLQWVLSTNYWFQVLVLTLKSDTVYIQKEGCHFIALLLHKSIVINDLFCSSVIQMILSPLIEAANKGEIIEQQVYQTLCPTLHLITTIFEILLELSTTIVDYNVFLVFKEKFHVEKYIQCIIIKLKNEDFVFALNKILYILSFFELVYKLGDTQKPVEVSIGIQASQKLFNVIIDTANRGTVSNILKLCYLGHIYWKHIHKRMPDCLSGDSVPLLFENQLMVLQLYPAAMVSFRLLGSNIHSIIDEDEYRDDLITKLCRKVIPPTFRIAFKWKTYLEKNFSFDHATLALKYVLHSMKFYTREIANTIFQILLHNLKDITNLLKDYPDQLMVLAQESNYMCLLLELIAVLIKEFTLTWKDNLETICVMEVTFRLLSFPVWATKVVTKGLSLMEIATSKYMTPSMVLLLDNMEDSIIPQIGPLIYAKLHDGSWEVRDGALELVRTISHLAIEFPSFRKGVLDAEFPCIVWKMSTGDAEPYVRAGAFKCLQEMVALNEIWCRILRNGNIFDQIFNVLHQETEGIVRCEAAALVAKIYEHQDLPKEVIDKLYNIMSHAVIVDLHWEVKVKALDFWHSVIERYLMHQGMIDGSFPNITFSKEHRKIVTLDETEVRKRLIKVLHQLSGTGCLAVIVSALQDECDVEVSKTAMNIVKSFITLLKQYNVTLTDETSLPANLIASSPLQLPHSINSQYLSAFNGILADETTFPVNLIVSSPLQLPHSIDSQYHSASPGSQISENASNPKSHKMDDSVIDDILNSQDLNLLETVFNGLNEPLNNSVDIKSRQIMLPANFLKYISGDLESHMNEKTQWIQDINNFESLLDDILKEYDNNDINSMDCY